MIIDELARHGTQGELAALLGITQPTVSALTTAGKLPAHGTLGELVLAYCTNLREVAAARHSEGPLDLAQERAGLAREQRIGVEIKNGVARGEYASVSLLAQVLARASQAVAEHISHLPGRIKTACPALPADALSVVLATIATARNEWVAQTAELEVALLQDDEGEADVGSAA